MMQGPDRSANVNSSREVVAIHIQTTREDFTEESPGYSGVDTESLLNASAEIPAAAENWSEADGFKGRKGGQDLMS
jgi:hypothetical protein